MRNRLSKSPVGPPITLSENFDIYESENFLLEGAVDEPWKAYWAAHVAHFYFQMDGQNPYAAGHDFPKVQSLIADGLEVAGYPDMANVLRKVDAEPAFNREVFSQYTADSPLFEEVNALLRRGNGEVSISTHPLTPWIAHLNAALRNEDEFMKTSFRGSELDDSQVAEYQVGRMFLWTSFTSLSMSRAGAMEGNTIFEVTPRSPISEHGKRAARTIAHYSEFPEEEEVLLPIASVFRVTSRESISYGRTVIRLDLLDHN